jgi:hypothetical protein
MANVTSWEAHGEHCTARYAVQSVSPDYREVLVAGQPSRGLTYRRLFRKLTMSSPTIKPAAVARPTERNGFSRT